MVKYKHYKGAIYEFICKATHSETNEALAIYKNEKNEIFARPYDMFMEDIVVNGETVPRFKKMED